MLRETWSCKGEEGRDEGSMTLHVDCAAGSDHLGDGSATRPWKTPRRARDAVRILKNTQPLALPVDVFLRGTCLPAGNDGAVDFTQPLLELTAEDSGTLRGPISYRSYPGEANARFMSGLTVPRSAWQRKEGSSKILSLNLTVLGIDSTFFGGFQRPRSRLMILVRFLSHLLTSANTKHQPVQSYKRRRARSVPIAPDGAFLRRRGYDVSTLPQSTIPQWIPNTCF